jgi:hypothetical protein
MGRAISLPPSVLAWLVMGQLNLLLPYAVHDDFTLNPSSKKQEL